MEKNELKPTTPRRGFLGTLATGAAALGLATLASPFKLQAQMEKKTPMSKPTNLSDEWFNKLTGKHRIVFDSTRPNGLMPFAWPKVFILTNGKTGTPANECGVVLVLRHDAIGYAFENRLWKKYDFAKVFNVTDPHDHTDKTPAVLNPMWNPDPKYAIPGVGEVAIGISDLQKDGVMICVCEMATTVFSAIVADQMKMNPEEVKKDWISGLLPGIQLVPSGVWAVGRAQEHGCQYCYAG